MPPRLGRDRPVTEGPSTASTRITAALQHALDAGLAEGVFPGASACVGAFREGSWELITGCRGAVGHGGPAVDEDTVYDLASLTKPWVAMTAIRAYQRGGFPLDQPVEMLIPEAAGHPIGVRTWEEVLTHRSGLVAWEPFYDRMPHAPGSTEAADWILADLIPRFDASQVGTSVYSDLGYILAGMALPRATGKSLDRLVTDTLGAPLGLQQEAFFGATRIDPSWRARCAPTGWSPWRGRHLRGEVHDDNCAALGGVAGHAGMFGTARAIARFGASWVGAWHGRRGALEEEAIHHATALRPRGMHRLGWDGRADEGSSAGTSIGVEAFGHLGFTGTSLWCDPRRELVIVLLTNRVAVSDDNAAIRAFRPRFHDAVIAAVDGAPR